MKNQSDVIVLGAGVAGLVANCELSKSGLSISIVEASDRIGGRAYTERDGQLDTPIEYEKFGSDGAQLTLAEPINGTLFFAGEARHYR